MRIAIHEPKPWQETLMHTSLRVALGVFLAVRGLLGLEAYGGIAALFREGFWRRWVAEFAVGEPMTDALLWSTSLTFVGATLMLGWFTRTAAVLAVGLVSFTITSQLLAGGPGVGWSQLEGPLLLLGASLYVAGIGAGDFSLDHLLRERARIRAIQRDERWLQPPYVAAEERHGEGRQS